MFYNKKNFGIPKTMILSTEFAAFLYHDLSASYADQHEFASVKKDNKDSGACCQ